MYFHIFYSDRKLFQSQNPSQYLELFPQLEHSTWGQKWEAPGGGDSEPFWGKTKTLSDIIHDCMISVWPEEKTKTTI